MALSLAGLPWLAGIIAALFVAAFKFVAAIFSKRLLIIAAVLSVVGSFTAAFYVAMTAAINSVSNVTPSFLNQAAGMVIPDNVPALISILVSARITRWVYEWNVKVAQWRI